jgi:4-hydroxybenzoate polyprenyltransferase
MVYDTIYAIQDKNDDVKAGVKSTALLFGDNLKPWLTVFATGSTALLALAGYMNAQGLLYYLISVGGAGLHYVWTVGGLDVKSRHDGAHRFRQSKWLGALVFGGVLADLIWKRLSKDEKTVEGSEKKEIERN